jgi:hypothetical protein
LEAGKKLHDELHNLLVHFIKYYSYYSDQTEDKMGRHLARMQEIRNEYKSLVAKSEENNSEDLDLDG